jgi:hypothetical protein
MFVHRQGSHSENLNENMTRTIYRQPRPWLNGRPVIAKAGEAPAGSMSNSWDVYRICKLIAINQLPAHEKSNSLHIAKNSDGTISDRQMKE